MSATFKATPAERFLVGPLSSLTPAPQLLCVKCSGFGACPYQWHWSLESRDFSSAFNVQKSRFHPHLSHTCLCFCNARFSLIDEHYYRSKGRKKSSLGLNHHLPCAVLVFIGSQIPVDHAGTPSTFPIGAEISLLDYLARLAKQGPQRGEQRAKEVM